MRRSGDFGPRHEVGFGARSTPRVTSPTLHETAAFGPLFRELDAPPTSIHAARGPAPKGPVRAVVLGPLEPGARIPTEAAGLERTPLVDEAVVVVALPAGTPDSELAAWRNELWPELHAVAIVSGRAGRAEQRTLSGTRPFDAELPDGTFLVFRRRAYVMSPARTVEKFDANAVGWNGHPGSPGYPHFRWMRRYVGLFADPAGAKRILDFGCGAGWVGIEAARRAPGCALRFFDPSPEMVRQATENARAAGLVDAAGRPGFGEDPPYPGPDEEPFDLVLSSGVVSFSPDRERWFDGLARAVAPGGRLVVGDIHRQSVGFRKRRARKPLLPVRELNALIPGEARGALEERGFRFVRSRGYQLSWPIPQAMHYSETRLKGLLSPPLLWANRAASQLFGGAQDRFDSWVLELVRA